MKRLFLLFALASVSAHVQSQFDGPQPEGQRWLEICVHFLDPAEQFNPPLGLRGVLEIFQERPERTDSTAVRFENSVKEPFAQICSRKIMLSQGETGKILEIELEDINFAAERRVTMMLLEQEQYVDSPNDFHFTPDSAVVEMDYDASEREYSGSVIVAPLLPGNPIPPVVQSGR